MIRLRIKLHEWPIQLLPRGYRSKEIDEDEAEESSARDMMKEKEENTCHIFVIDVGVGVELLHGQFLIEGEISPY